MRMDGNMRRRDKELLLRFPNIYVKHVGMILVTQFYSQLICLIENMMAYLMSYSYNKCR